MYLSVEYEYLFVDGRLTPERLALRTGCRRNVLERYIKYAIIIINVNQQENERHGRYE